MPIAGESNDSPSLFVSPIVKQVKSQQDGSFLVTKLASSPSEMLCCVITTRDNEVRLAYPGYLR